MHREPHTLHPLTHLPLWIDLKTSFTLIIMLNVNNKFQTLQQHIYCLATNLKLPWTICVCVSQVSVSLRSGKNRPTLLCGCNVIDFHLHPCHQRIRCVCVCMCVCNQSSPVFGISACAFSI